MAWRAVAALRTQVGALLDVHAAPLPVPRARWTPPRTARRLDTLLAVLGGVYALLVLADDAKHSIALGALGAAAVLPIAWVRRWPLIMSGIGLAASVAFTESARLHDPLDGLVAGAFLMAYPLILGAAAESIPACAGLSMCLLVLGVLGAGATSWGEIVSSAAVAVGAWTASRVLRAGAAALDAGVQAAADEQIRQREALRRTLGGGSDSGHPRSPRRGRARDERDRAAGHGRVRVWDSGWRISDPRRAAPERVMIRVLLADDQSLVLTGSHTILSGEPDIDVVGRARDGYEAIRLAAELSPDVVLMDIRMPGVDGVTATKQILAAGTPSPKVFMLTTFDLDEYVYAALVAAASGFLVKDIPDQQLVDGVRPVHGGDTLLAPSVSRRLIQEFVRRPPGGRPIPGADTLTARELEVWQLVTAGRSNAEIARELFLGRGARKDPRLPPDREARRSRPYPTGSPGLRRPPWWVGRAVVPW